MTQRHAAFVTFNCEWHRPSSAKGALIAERIRRASPDVVCLSESYAAFLGNEGYALQATYPYPQPDRRILVLWSRNPWRALEGSDYLDHMGFVAGETETPAGVLRIAGVCIPYRFSGRYEEPAKPVWKDHLDYVEALQDWLANYPDRTVVMGDFNQRIPRLYQPRHVFAALEHRILASMRPATAHLLGPTGDLAIDHICHSADLSSMEPRVLSNLREDGGPISDHFGVSCLVSRAMI